jgi:hypothetical protein
LKFGDKKKEKPKDVVEKSSAQGLEVPLSHVSIGWLMGSSVLIRIRGILFAHGK